MTGFVNGLLSGVTETSTAAFIKSNSVRCGDNNNNRFCTPAFEQNDDCGGSDAVVRIDL